MEKYVVNYVNYKPSHTIEKQRKKKYLEKYINAGYEMRTLFFIPILVAGGSGKMEVN